MIYLKMKKNLEIKNAIIKKLEEKLKNYGEDLVSLNFKVEDESQ